MEPQPEELEQFGAYTGVVGVCALFGGIVQSGEKN